MKILQACWETVLRFPSRACLKTTSSCEKEYIWECHTRHSSRPKKRTQFWEEKSEREGIFMKGQKYPFIIFLIPKPKTLFLHPHSTDARHHKQFPTFLWSVFFHIFALFCLGQFFIFILLLYLPLLSFFLSFIKIPFKLFCFISMLSSLELETRNLILDMLVCKECWVEMFELI